MRNYLFALIVVCLFWHNAFSASFTPGFLFSPLHGAAPLLSPSEAFKVRASRTKDAIVIRLSPSSGYYLYQDRLHVRLDSGGTARITGVSLPPAERKDDPAFGVVSIYPEPFDMLVHLSSPPSSQSKLVLTYQGCNERGICYPPQTRVFQVDTLTLETSGHSGGGILAPGTLTKAFWSQNVLEILAAFFGFGLLLAFTPCMLPMVPILSAIILGQKESVKAPRKLVLGASYVAGMALVYALAGVAAGLSGVYLADALQNPWVLALFGLFFLMLAMAMFGFYSLELPHAVQNRLHLMTGNMKGGRAWVVFFMGGVSAVLVGPCIAPPLAGALLYISHAQNAPLGAMALFFMALGMGLPLVVVGLTAGTLLPRTGVWMEEVKRFFGIVLLGTGFYVVSPILPISVLMMAYALLAFLAAWLIWHATSSFRQFRYGLALLRVVAGIFLAIGLAETVGVLNGSSDIFSPLSSQRESLPHFLPANTLAALDRQLALARGRPVMLDFYADWCVSCKEMDRFVFSRPRVKQALSGLVLIRADVTVNSADTRLLMKHFGLYGPPVLLFFDKQGREIHSDRVVGALSEGQFLTFLSKILPGH